MTLSLTSSEYGTLKNHTHRRHEGRLREWHCLVERHNIACNIGFACCVYAGNFPPATSGSGYMIMSARGLDKRPGGEIISFQKWRSGRLFFYNFGIPKQRGLELYNHSLFFPFFLLTARRICCALLSIEDANMTAFFPPTRSRDPARYLMEKYWLWCVVQTVHNPGKSFREDFRRAFEPLPSNTALPLFFVFLCNEHVIWSWAMGIAFCQV